MVNQVWGKHNKFATGTNDTSKQVSVNVWNESVNRKGLLGFDAETIASAASVTIPADTQDASSDGSTSSFIKLSGTTSVDTIVQTNTAEGDLLWLITTGSVTLNDATGNIHLLGDANKDLSTTVPTILMRVGAAWYEYGGSSVTNGSITFAKIQDIDSMRVIGRTAGSSGVSSAVTILDSDTMSGASDSTLATSESIKAYVDTEVATIPVGDITGVTAGTGLSGGGTTGTVSLAVDATIATIASPTFTGTVVLPNVPAIVTTQLDLKAPLASPTFTGTVAIPNYANVETTLDGIATNATAVALRAPIASPTFTGTVVLPNVPAIVTTQLDLKAPLAGPTFTGTVTTATLDVAGNDIDNVQNVIHDYSVSGTDIDFDEDQLQTYSMTGNVTFTSVNEASGKSKTLKITTDGSVRTFSAFPDWKWVGAEPTEQAASKVAILTLTCFGTADTDVIAAYAVEA